MKKRLLAVILTLVLLIGLLPTAAFAAEPPAVSGNWIDAGNYDDTWYNATGTEFILHDAADLAGLAVLVNGGNKFAGKKIILGDHIDLSGKQWSPIGGGSVYFAGEFNGKTISNMTDTRDEARKGLFGLVENCYIHDLTLKDVRFSGNTSGARIGAVAGNLQSNGDGKGCILMNITIDGLNYHITDTDGLIGGLVGYSWNSYIKNCIVKNAAMSITSTADSAVGGMIAYGRGVTENCTLADFPTYGASIAAEDVNSNGGVINYVGNQIEGITAALSGTVTFGGFLGADTYNHWRNYAKNNTVTGLSVTCAAGDGIYTVGGFMGGQYGGYDPAAMSGNTVTGTIAGSGTNAASTFGGFMGYKGGRPGGATGCTANVDITVAAGDVGGFCGETQQYFAHEYTFDNCEAGGDVSTSNGTAGGFIANVQHGGDGSTLNVTVTDCTVSGNVTGTSANAIIGNINDVKNNTPTGGEVIADRNTVANGVTVNDEAVTSGNMYGGNTTLFPAAHIGDQGYQSMAAAIAAAQNGDTIVLADGTHTWDASLQIKNKAVTFTGSRGAVIDMTNIHTGQNTSGATLTFKGVTMTFGDKDYMGFAHTAKVVYDGCFITGKQHLYAPVVEFTNCTLENRNDYSVWTYGASDVKFIDCTFNSGGKAVLVYNESNTNDFVANILLSGCTFNDDGTLDTAKGAVELGQSPYGKNAYHVTFENCTVNGFAVNDEGISTGSTFWGNKNSITRDSGKGGSSVTINGSENLMPAPVPAGEVSRGAYFTSNNRIQGAVMNANPTESVVLELYSGETKIATTTLTKTEYFENAKTELTWSFCITGTSTSWNTVWEVGHPRTDFKPDKVVLYIDGAKVDENTVTLHKNNFDMVGEEAVWSEIAGVKTPAEKPQANFSAVTMKLTGVTAQMQYRIGATGQWNGITGTEVDLTGVVTDACAIQIQDMGNGVNTTVSEIQEISVSKGEQPSLVATQPTVIGGKGSIATTADHEYSEDGLIYIPCTGAMSEVDPNTYYVRRAANGLTLASEPQIIVIHAFVPGQQTTPTAVFTATGPSTGTLANVAAGMEYSINGGASWTAIDSDSVNLTGLSAGTIQVVNRGNNSTTTDSPVQTITVDKADKPTGLGKVDCETMGDTGRLTGITTEMEYRRNDGAQWTPGTGADLTGLAAGTYYVRMKANGTVLASDYETLVIEAYNASGNADITGITVAGVAATGSGTSYTVTLPHGTVVTADSFAITRADEKATLGAVTETSANVWTFVVTAENGTPVTYTVTVSFEAAPTQPVNPVWPPVVTPPVDTEPEITANQGGSYRYSNGMLTITPDEGYEIADVKLNGVSMGAVTALTGLDGNDEVEITFAKEQTEVPVVNPFTDVKEGDYYYEAVLWAVQNGITQGTSTTTFSPDKVCTRAQAITFLWRAAGSPMPSSMEHSFTDLDESQYYYLAVLWAVEKGITQGATATTFAPDRECDRSVIVTFLYRLAGEPEVEITGSFDDVVPGSYYEKAVQWAVNNGITQGTGTTTFSPDKDCTRAQIVTFLWRFFTQGE